MDDKITYMADIGLRNTKVIDGKEVFIDSFGKPEESKDGR